jgi:hypothetical protein
MKFELIDDWDHVLKRAWSIRVAIFWSAVGAFILVAPLVSDEAKALVGPWQYGGVLFIAAVSFSIARFTKQPGADE